jgi:hypothetical protein
MMCTWCCFFHNLKLAGGSTPWPSHLGITNHNPISNKQENMLETTNQLIMVHDTLLKCLFVSWFSSLNPLLRPADVLSSTASSEVKIRKKGSAASVPRNRREIRLMQTERWMAGTAGLQSAWVPSCSMFGEGWTGTFVSSRLLMIADDCWWLLMVADDCWLN